VEQKVALKRVLLAICPSQIRILTFKDMFMAMTENKINVDASHQLPIQGLLGTPFLQLYKTVINFPAKTIAFYNN
jgi:hypothetical protein